MGDACLCIEDHSSPALQAKGVGAAGALLRRWGCAHAQLTARQQALDHHNAAISTKRLHQYGRRHPYLGVGVERDRFNVATRHSTNPALDREDTRSTHKGS